MRLEFIERKMCSSLHNLITVSLSFLLRFSGKKTILQTSFPLHYDLLLEFKKWFYYKRLKIIIECFYLRQRNLENKFQSEFKMKFINKNVNMNIQRIFFLRLLKGK